MCAYLPPHRGTPCSGGRASPSGGSTAETSLVRRARAATCMAKVERVVRALRAVDMVVRVHVSVQPSTLIGAVGNDLVDIHIRLRAAAVCQTASGKLPSSEPSRIFVAGSLDCAGPAGVEQHRAAHWHARRRSFTTANARMTSGGIFSVPMRKFFKAALRLRAPVTVGGHTHLTRYHAPDGIPSCNLFSQKSQMRHYTPICPRAASPETVKKQRCCVTTALLHCLLSGSAQHPEALDLPGKGVIVPALFGVRGLFGSLSVILSPLPVRNENVRRW